MTEGMKKVKRIIKVVLLFTMLYFKNDMLYAQLNINSSMTPQQLVQNVLVGGGVTISNVTMTGSATLYGYFSSGNTTNLGLDAGVLLTTGNASYVNQPVVQLMSDEMMLPGDFDLDSLTSSDTHDACILEFDFIPQADTIRFRYVFGSEEYPEYVCSQFNDVFGFFLSGPGISGPYSNNSTNIALIPGTTLPVAINTVNKGSMGTYGNSTNCTSLAYSMYYVDNEALGGTTIVFDGFTKVFTAWHVVTPCQTYHIKLAISDVWDGYYDSGVFLEANSFSTPSINIDAHASMNDSLMVEGCGNGTYIFSRSGDLNCAYTVNYLIEGSAINGTDYQDITGQPIANNVIFPIGIDTVTLTIYPVQDNISEPDESIIILIPQVASCNEDTLKATLYIKNVDPIKVMTTGDTLICNEAGEYSTIQAIVVGGYGPYIYSWFPISGNTSTFSVSPSLTTTYTVVVTDTCGTANASDTIIIEVLCLIEIPNVFTPNNDNINEFFYINNIEQYPASKLTIFNRWGRKVYESTNYKNEWDGRGNSEGVYYYVLTLNNRSTYNGTVTILR